MISNLCKKREWNTLNRTFHYDYYFTYYLNKKKLGSYLNTWFVDRLEISNGIIYNDSLITLKKVDKDTSDSLYRRPFNPLSIFIIPDRKSLNDYLTALKNKKKLPILLYTMKCHLHSIDDSSYGIWWDNTLFEDLQNKRIELMNWINQFNTKNLLNGEKLLDKCVELGANPESKDYN